MRTSVKNSGLVVVLLAALLLVSGCSGPDKTTLSNTSREPTGFEEPTIDSEPTGETGAVERTLEEDSRETEVTLRVEGDPQTRFSGLCTVGDQNTVFKGQVPKQFTYDLDHRSISCRIQKQDSGNGSLRVVLLAGDNTRSVQQTNTQRGTINISYSGG